MKFALLIAVASIALAAVVSQVSEPSVDTAPDTEPTSASAAAVASSPSSSAPSSTAAEAGSTAVSDSSDTGASDSSGTTVSTIEVTGSHDLRVEAIAPVPLRVRVASLDIDIALDSVGVDADGDFDVPRSGVGWYRHGPSPGSDGSAVLAAHVDFNGAPGAFFRLSELVPGDRIEVDSDDGMTRVFTVVDQVLYDKTVLPADELFREDGDEALRLITCGGSFDADARSYLGNRVVTAVPTDEFRTVIS